MGVYDTRGGLLRISSGPDDLRIQIQAEINKGPVALTFYATGRAIHAIKRECEVALCLQPLAALEHDELFAPRWRSEGPAVIDRAGNLGTIRCDSPEAATVVCHLLNREAYEAWHRGAQDGAAGL